ncbi:hypothetical protein HZH66_015345 [Vespula vulgaris]|uniref:Uncharacterized protein n=1 Tax=Vespula vulgaris TaxID=7454 RepID=A0A834MPX0_VESVU|nr:hypothetical protein HZH66_015345 [Vespula vulgaris]
MPRYGTRVPPNTIPDSTSISKLFSSRDGPTYASLHFRTLALSRSRQTLARSKVYDVLRDISRSRVVPFNGDPLLVRHVGTYLPNAYPLPARARRNPDSGQRLLVSEERL